MEQLRHSRVHPSMVKRYVYVVEYVEKLPSKKSYADPKQCAQEGLTYAKAKYKDNLLKVHVLDDKNNLLETWHK